MNLLDTLFENSDLSTEFKTKVSTIFEAAVSEQADKRLQESLDAIQETYDRKLNEEREKFITEQSTFLEQFIDRIVLEWAEENSPRLDNQIKVDIAESFMDGLKNLFLEHNVNVEEATAKDVVEALEARNAELTEELEQTIFKAEAIAEALESHLKAEIVAEMTVGLTDTQAEKVIKLTENFTFESPEEFKTRVGYIVEAFGGASYIPPIPQDAKPEVVQIGFIDPESGEYVVPVGGATTGTTQGTNESVTPIQRSNSLIEATLRSIKK